MPLLELLQETRDKTVVEVLITQVGVSSDSPDLEDTLLDGQERHIEGSSIEIKGEDIPLARSLLVETIGDGCSGGLVDDTKNVEVLAS